jgi:hypothetical protein
MSSNPWEGDPDLSKGVRIRGTYGDVLGVGVSGSGHTIGKNIVIGDGTITVSDQRLTEIQNNEYAQSLKAFTDTINQQLKGKQIPEEEVKSINKSVDELANEVKDIKPGQEGIDYIKKRQLGTKFVNVAKNVLKVFPKTTETIAAFTPLVPFSRLIGERVEQVAQAIQQEV